jgi:hydrogenase/urease accessory protein HupE
MSRRFFLFCAALLLFLAGVSSAQAHEIHPAYLELQQTAPDTYAVLWKVPAVSGVTDGFHPQFPPDAKIISPIVHHQTADTFLERYQLRVPGGLAGRTLSVAGPTAVLADVLVRVVATDGSAQILRLNPATPTALVAASQGRLGAAATYLRLGIEHILTGVDHLLFVLGLMLIVQNRWALVKTITAFTVAHSITLAVATLGYARAPLPPLNACIALSILFLGPEIIRVQRGETSLTIRHPWVVAFVFGLLHGFGFASGLTALGLPHAEVPWALVSFNVGVEIGQLFFLAIILLLERSFVVLEIRWPRWAKSAPCYTVGSLGAFWTIQRVWLMF